MLSNEYAAGLVDGEGCISISKSKRKGYKNYQFYLKVVITNTNKDILNLFQEQFGGSVLNRSHGKKHWTPAYNWQLTCRQAESFLKLILPFLYIKKEEAKVALQFQDLLWETKTPRWPSEEARLSVIEQKIELYRKLASLKPSTQSKLRQQRLND